MTQDHSTAARYIMAVQQRWQGIIVGPGGRRAHLTMWSATTSVSGWRTVLTTCSGRTLSAFITCSCTCAMTPKFRPSRFCRALEQFRKLGTVCNQVV
jgi:hypothetical protein